MLKLFYSFCWMISFVLGLLMLTVVSQPNTPIFIVDMFRFGISGPQATTFDHSWGVQYAQLTSPGMRQQYILGQLIHQNYPNLTATYTPSDIYVRATDYNVTIMSAAAHLTGIFNLTGGPNLTELQIELAVPPYQFNQNFSEGLGSSALPNNYLPVPIHTVELDKDYLLYSYNPSVCPYAVAYTNYQGATSTYALFEAQQQPTLQTLKQITHQDFNLVQASILAQTIQADYANFRSVPSPYNQIITNKPLWQNLTFINDYTMFYNHFGNESQIQLFSYNIFSAILSYFEGKINGTSSLNIVLYSGHETSMIPLLVGLGIANASCIQDIYLGLYHNPLCHSPTYSSSLIFELWDGDTHYVRVLYEGMPANLCGNSEGFCTYNDFVSLVNGIIGNMTLVSYFQTCNSPLYTPPIIDDYYNCFAGIFGTFCVIFVIAIVQQVLRIRKENQIIIRHKSMVKSLLLDFQA